MDPSPPRKELRLQGPRPSALKIRNDSHKVKKPPPHHKPLPKPTTLPDPPRQPVIIYSVSPKIIYADETEFRSLVQRLTGPSPSPSSSNYITINNGNVSPAARLASVEKTISPKEWDRERKGMNMTDSDVVVDDGVNGVEMNYVPGILSPAPGSLPPISDGFFSSVMESPQQMWLSNMNGIGHEFSPGFRYGGFTPSPSALFTNVAAPSITSPTISYDLFNHFMDP